MLGSSYSIAGMAGGWWVLSFYQNSHDLTWWFILARLKLLSLRLDVRLTGHLLSGTSKQVTEQQEKPPPELGEYVVSAAAA